MELAAEIAEAQVDLQRVRRTRSDTIGRALSNPLYRKRSEQNQITRAVLRVMERGLRGSDALILRDAVRPMSGPEHHARVLAGLAKELAKLDRYERRALSRRKFAIRRLDAAQKHPREDRGTLS